MGSAIGVLLSIEEPTRPMNTEAAGAGFYTSAFNGQLIAGVAIERPSGNVTVDETFKKAPKAKGKSTAQGELL